MEEKNQNHSIKVCMEGWKPVFFQHSLYIQLESEFI